MRAFLLSLSVLTAVSLSAEPVRIIFDSDMIVDFDDVGAFRVG